MWTPKWLLAIPVALAATFGMAQSQGASIIDGAAMFSAGAIQKAQSELSRIESETRLPVTIETVDSLEGDSVQTVLRRHAESSTAQGLYVLIAKQEGKFDIEASRAFRGGMNSSRLAAIKTSFVSGLKKRDFDSALLGGTESIRNEAKAAAGAMANGAAGRRGVAGRGNPQGGFGVGSLLGIGLLIVGVMFLFRILGGLFRGGAQAGQGSGMGRMGAPGYGGGGGGMGGGGFMSGLFGGIGGALAGNWLYDQFSGRSHQGSNESAGYNQQPDNSAATDWSGGTDQSADWGGGGDTGAGGDWGGGGGGGGGDWGGGGGGGDW